MEKSRFRSLDEACEHIERAAASKVEAQEPPQEHRWWSYDSHQDISSGGSAVEHVALEDLVSGPPGFSFQRCGGGRRVIRKSRGGY